MNNTDREKLINWIRYTYVSNPPYSHKATVDDTADAVIADILIANGVVVREKGEWESYWDDAYLSESYRCSRCKEDAPSKAETMHDQLLTPFCPNCGADMRKKN